MKKSHQNGIFKLINKTLKYENSILKIFGFLDQDGNGVIEVDDLVALHGIMGEKSEPG